MHSMGGLFRFICGFQMRGLGERLAQASQKGCPGMVQRQLNKFFLRQAMQDPNVVTHFTSTNMISDAVIIWEIIP